MRIPILSTMRRLLSRAGIAALLFAVPATAWSQQPVFLSATESRQVLGSRDEFIARMSPFDRSSRLKTDRPVSESEYLAFAASDARDWEENEKDSVREAFLQIQPAMMRLGISLPAQVFIIKTSGEEAEYAAYTRGTSVIFPAKMIGPPGQAFQSLLAHELFHVFSRANPATAKALYNAIGFEYCGEVDLPVDLERRRLTNPDAPVNDHCIEVTINGRDEWVVPVLLSPSPRFEPANGGDYMDYVRFRLLVVERSADAGDSKASFANGLPRLHDLGEVSGFFEKVGDNTGYVIHPEEIVADNFAMLVVGESNLNSPWVSRRIREILANSRQ